jgi:hypothetical protein
MSTQQPKLFCACGESAMPGFDVCAVCHAHPQLIAAIERRTTRHLLAALSRASDALSKDPAHDAVRVALAIIAWGLGATGTGAVRKEAHELFDHLSAMAGRQVRALREPPLCLMCNRRHPSGDCPPDEEAPQS